MVVGAYDDSQISSTIDEPPRMWIVVGRFEVTGRLQPKPPDVVILGQTGLLIRAAWINGIESTHPGQIVAVRASHLGHHPVVPSVS